MFCTDILSPLYLIFSDSVPELLYYSHIPTVIISLMIAIFVYIKNRNLASKILLALTSVFSIWVFLNLISWTNIDSKIIMFSWSFFGVLTLLLSVLSLYLTYVFINKKDVLIKTKIFFLVMIMSVLLPAISYLKEFNIPMCEAEDNIYYINYYQGLCIFIFLWIIIFSTYKYFKTKEREEKKQIFLLSSGISLFLISFFITGYFASLWDNFELEQYGLFGMTIFMAFFAYLIVRFKAFDIKLIGSQALVVGIIILIGSQFFFIQSNTNMVLNSITLVVSTIMGFLIVRSVKKEVTLRERIEILAGNLERANSNLRHFNTQIKEANEKLKELDQLKTEFVGLATHQIRGPLTAIKGYLSMVLEGDYGEISKSIEDPLRVIFSSAESLSVVVSDFLNVSRIEQGQMKYNMEDYDIRELVEEVIKELKPNTESRGLQLKTEISTEPCIVHIDKEKVKQVINNLIDNSSKYTKEGSITVSLEKKDNSKVLLAIKDTGVGIAKETLPHLFEKFSRAKDAFKTNILGTGLGLYVAKKMMEAHKGRVWAESEGEGKGSQFYVEFEEVK
ncbi:MAG: ATP-binding protein [Candidatus Pacebacteria bacterium]|nr:ATP-binding protein [Candidatus Paceibacterota bacterium]